MARKAKTGKEDVPALRNSASRLELIKRRHEELILKPRATIAADLSNELDDPYEELLGTEQMELADTADAVQV